MKSVSLRDICTPMFIATLFKVANIWKQPKCPSMDEGLKDLDEWITKYKQRKSRMLFIF
jgi:hypothetical protein